jgi:hypothetical protein
MRRLKFAAIWCLDWIVDVRILRHRFPRYCEWVADHPWWGPESWRGSPAPERPEP